MDSGCMCRDFLGLILTFRLCELTALGLLVSSPLLYFDPTLHCLHLFYWQTLFALFFIRLPNLLLFSQLYIAKLSLLNLWLVFDNALKSQLFYISICYFILLDLYALTPFSTSLFFWCVMFATCYLFVELRNDHKDVTEKISQNIQLLHSAKLTSPSEHNKGSGWHPNSLISVDFVLNYYSLINDSRTSVW